ncbi:variant surface glycoprotein (VSG, atypical), putative [Trypanosoma brucei brucei TREU927]|uniref:Variant surface glycoprotein (VSG, atypical), putative n=1 Tax=Trypanosoma brucei brucei (strain 927/4 GUTat10.1) TaxID=185431 RepID=Q38G18_TRYB2|nr:variant surface glycoprotein [Trypanosoma brucei brucei TREU927]EAN76252.1 variant surface glycoprotein (VSG, atypical), putative [Trypanosoma brucei brucei TREU927]
MFLGTVMKATTITCFALKLLSMAVLGSQDPQSTAAITDACTEIRYMLNVRQHFDQQIRNLAQAAEELHSQSKVLRLAAAKHVGTKKGLAYTLLAGLAAARESQAQKHLTEWTPKFTNAIQELSARIAVTDSGRTSGGAPTEKYGSAETDATTDQRHGATQRCKVSLTLTPSAPAKCSTASSEEKLKKAASELPALDKLKLIQTKLFGQYKAEVNLQSKGSSAVTRPIAGNAGCESASGASTDSVDMKFLTLSKPAPEFDTPKIEEDAGCREPNQQNDIHVHTAETLIHALCRARKFPTTNQQKLGPESLDSISSDSTAQEIALRLSNKYKKDQPENQRQEAVKDLLGKGTDSIQTKWLNDLSKTDSTLKLQDDAQPISIDAASQTDFDKALALFTAQAYQRAVKQEKTSVTENPSKKTDTEDKTEEKKDGDNKTTAADCKASSETNCDKTKCDWNAEKKQCKVKEGAAVISAVIKSPLLLEFLLLA